MIEQTFLLEKLLNDVFAPRQGEKVVVMIDLPHDHIKDNPDWADRRVMAEEWRQAFIKLGLNVYPLLSYPATGASNADLPNIPEIAKALNEVNIAVAMTQFSATAPLSAYVKKRPDFRTASMPNVLRRMEKSALAADYKGVARKTHILAERLTRADSAEIIFETGHRCVMDLRYREGHADDGVCTPDKKGFRLINLPSGEAFIVPYEGERSGEPSRTNGEIPIRRNGEDVVLQIKENRIENIVGENAFAQKLREHFAVDPARRNVAELGLGCNERAIVTGNVLEDEKAGFHWAYGRSEHLGGVVSPANFFKPENVVHHDIVYAQGCPIGIKLLALVYPDGSQEVIMKQNRYCIF